MATVIDSLIVELGLDPAQFTKGQKTAAEAFAKTKEEAVKSGKGIEEASEKAAQSLAKVARQALELYAIFLGGRGIAQFIADITAGDSALGRFSASMGESPRVVAAWGLAVEEVGGSSQATAASMRSLSDKIEELHTQGKALPLAFYQIQAAGGKTIDINNGVGKSFLGIAANLKAIAATDATKAHWLGRQLGLDPDTVNRMIQDGDRMGAVVEKFKRLVASDKDIAAAQALQKSWTDLTQEAEHIGRALWTSVSPALIHAMDQFDKWIGKKENQEKFNALIQQFSDWIAGIDWNKAEKGVEDFAKAADDAAKSVGGWKTVGEALFGVWAVSKIAGIVTGVWGLVTAIRAATAAGALLALNPIIAALAAGAIGIKAIDAIPSKSRDAMRHGDGTVQAPSAEHQQMRNRAGATPSSGGGWGAISGAFNKLFGVTGAKAEGVQMEGRPVDRGNPLAVMVTNGGNGGLFGKGVNGSSGPGGGGSTPSSGSGGGGTPSSDGSGRDYGKGDGLTPEQGAALLRSQGATPEEAAYIGAHMGGESRGHAGAHNFVGADRSYGLWQINMLGGMGDQRRKMWGLKSNEDLYDPSVNAKAALALYRDWVRRGRRGPSPWAGSDRFLNPNYSARVAKAAREWSPNQNRAAPTVPRVTPSPSVTNSTNTSTRATTSTSTNETHVGQVVIHTQATDAAGIAKEIPKAIERSSFASQANAGPE